MAENLNEAPARDGQGEADGKKKELTDKQRDRKFRAAAREKTLLASPKGFVSRKWGMIGGFLAQGLQASTLADLIKENYEVDFTQQQLIDAINAHKAEVETRKAKKAAAKKK